MMSIDLIDDGLIRFGREEGAASNAALDDWVGEQLDKGQELPEPAETRRAQGACRLCNERPAHYVCVHCDRDVCKEDYWIMLGVCRRCVTDEEVAASREAKRSPPPELGIKWVED